jgi:AraC-like DNA-binding protein
VFLGAIPYIFSDLEHKLTLARAFEASDMNSTQHRPNAILPPMFNRTLRPIHLLVYSIVIWITIYKYKIKIFKNNNHSQDFLIIKKWLLVFSSLVPLMAIFHFFIFYTSVVSESKSIFIEEGYPLLVIFSVLFVLMIVSLLFFPHILYGMPVKIFLPSENLQPQNLPETLFVENKVENLEINLAELPSKNQPNEKFVQLFSEEYIKDINIKINSWIDSKTFLDPESNISTLAVQIKIPQHHLSYYFNTILNVKFTDWRNQLKIEYAVSLLDQENHKNYTLEAFSIQCGFISQSTFIRAFKNAKGMTPSEYMKGGGEARV